jgi:hypothetical protein
MCYKACKKMLLEVEQSEACALEESSGSLRRGGKDQVMFFLLRKQNWMIDPLEIWVQDI